jgi:hypothetical protein
MLFGASITLGIFALLGGRPRLWEVTGYTILNGSTSALVTISLLLALLTAFKLRKRLSERSLVQGIVAGGSLTAALVFATDWFSRSYSLFRGPGCRGEIVVCTALSYALLKGSRARLLKALPVFAGLAALLAWALFLNHANGRTLVSDDHSVFFYRLQLLKEHFPFIPFYNPLWNGGIDSRDFFASGSLNVFLLLAPVIYLFDLGSSYTGLVGIILFGAVPTALWLTCRILGLNRATASIAALLSLSSSLLWYRWTLKYGTIGFGLSAGLAPLCWALWQQACQGTKNISRRYWLALGAVTTLTIFWSLAVVVLIPLGLRVLWSLPQLIKKPGAKLFLVSLVAVNLPWILLFASVSQVGSFLAERPATQTTVPSIVSSDSTNSITTLVPQNDTAHFGSRHRSGGLNPQRAVELLRAWATSLNPLLFLFGVTGIWCLPKSLQKDLAALLIWLFILGTIAVPMKPQLELDRMLIVMGIFLIIPASRGLAAFLLKSPTDHTIPARMRQATLMARCLCSGMLLVGLLQTYGVIQGRSLEQFTFESDAARVLAASIVAHAGEGRVIFTGCVVHELDEGHLAPLVLRTKRPMVASSYVHNLWRYKQVIPDSFLSRGDLGIREYFDLMNATAVAAHDPKWRSYFLNRPSDYELIQQGPPFTLFRRVGVSPSYFHAGSGEIIEQTTNHVTFKPAAPEGVLKFSWFPFVRATNCTLYPFPVDGSITLIGFSGCKSGSTVTIDSVSPLSRLLSN